MADVVGGIVADLQATDNLSGPFNRARQAMAALEAEMARLEAEQRKGRITTADYVAKTNELVAAHDRLSLAMRAAAPRVNALDSAFGAAASRGQAFSRGMVDLSRGVEDFATGGFLGVLNNIPGIFTNMASAAGVSAATIAGWTTGVSLAATGAYVLYRNWDSIEALWSGGETLTEAQRMEELGKQTSRTADEQDRLNRYKREQNTIAEQSKRRPKEEGETGRAVGAAIGEVGADELRVQVRRKMLDEMGPITKAAIEERARSIDALGAAMSSPDDPANSTGGRLREKAAKQLRDERDKLVAAEADKLLANAETGPGKLGEDSRRKLREMLPGEAGGIFGAPFETPEAAESRRLVTEGNANAANYDFFHGLNEGVRKQTDELIRQHREQVQEDLARPLEEQDAAARAGDQVTQDAFARVKGMREQNKLKEERNEELNKDFFALPGLAARGSDLNDRLRQLMNPERQGRSLGLDAYEQSHRATTGDSPELKQMREIWKVNQQIAENTKKIKTLTAAPR